MNLVEEWHKYLAGNSHLDEFDFAFLIEHDITEAKLFGLFGTFPNAGSMVDRILQVIGENNSRGMYVIPNPKNRLSEQKLVDLAKVYRDSVRRFLESSGKEDVAQELKGDNVEIVNNFENFMQISGDYSLGHSEAEDEVTYIFDDYFEKFGPSGYALDEAVLHLTKDPVITRYIFEKSVDFPLSSEPYYRLWKGGGDMIFLKDRMIVLSES